MSARHLLGPVLAAGLLATGAALAAVDVNTASREQLDALRGIGPALSARIVAERGKAPFRDLDDLQRRVRGIGEQTARKLAADGLTVGAAPARATAGAGAAVAPGVAGDRSRAASAAATTAVGQGLVTELRPSSDAAAARSPGLPAR